MRSNLHLPLDDCLGRSIPIWDVLWFQWAAKSCWIMSQAVSATYLQECSNNARKLYCQSNQNPQIASLCHSPSLYLLLPIKTAWKWEEGQPRKTSVISSAPKLQMQWEEKDVAVLKIDDSGCSESWRLWQIQRHKKKSKGPALCWVFSSPHCTEEQVQRKMWGKQGGGGESEIALFRLGKGGKGSEKDCFL